MPEIAAALVKLSKFPNVVAAYWQQTSVAQSLWLSVEDENESEGWRMYDITKDDKHWFLFEELLEKTASNPHQSANEKTEAS